jgi:uncharacterized protein Yka (UPF0111/DUF47 family)
MKREQASELSHIAGMLELSKEELKTTLIEMLRTLVDKVNSMQEQMESVSREIKILRKTKKSYL